MTLAALTALSAGAAALGASCGLSFSGISDPRSNEQPHNAIPMSASANGGCQIRRSHAKPCWGRGEAIYGSLALEHDPDPKGRVGESMQRFSLATNAQCVCVEIAQTTN
ncbi:hypothetical protein TM239_36670 [Bradyrhizobium sp. TM239]|nr:hypothetical protein TM239_36670 [Bradyrhizobium sp. TM239]